MKIECETETQTKKVHIFIRIKDDIQTRTQWLCTDNKTTMVVCRTQWLCTDNTISSTYKPEQTKLQKQEQNSNYLNEQEAQYTGKNTH